MSSYITAREAAKRTGYHPVYVQKLLREGKLPGYKRGRWFIDADELDRFIRGNHSQVEATK